MRVLAIDTALEACSAAVLDRGSIVASETLPTHICLSCSEFRLTVNICSLYHKYTVLSPTDTRYWAAIREFSARRRRMPSYGEIMELVGFRSRHAVTRLMDRLVAEGLVTKDPQGKLIPHAP